MSFRVIAASWATSGYRSVPSVGIGRCRLKVTAPSQFRNRPNRLGRFRSRTGEQPAQGLKSYSGKPSQSTAFNAVCEQGIGNDLGAGFGDCAFGRSGRGRRLNVHTFPFLINTADSYLEESWLFRRIVAFQAPPIRPIALALKNDRSGRRYNASHNSVTIPTIRMDQVVYPQLVREHAI